MSTEFDRRSFLNRTGALLASGFTPFAAVAKEDRAKGLVIGQPEAGKAGNDVLTAGGIAADAIVAAALVAGVVSVPLTGIGGYGGHFVIAGLTNWKTAAIDFNTVAPAALREDDFHADEKGNVKDDVHAFGWLAVGVPGLLAGLQKCLDLYGTRRFPELVKPAIRHAREGFPINKRFAGSIKDAEKQCRRDPASAKLLLPMSQLV